MENVIESIRLATQPDATDAARVEGVRACRAVLAALETAQGQPLASVAPAPEVNPMQAVVAGLSNMSVEQLLDLAIVRLKAIVPPVAPTKALTTPAPPQTLRIPMLPVPRGRG